MDGDNPHGKNRLLKRLKISYYKHVSDRRRYLRKHLRVKVTEKVSKIFEHFTSTNISAGGMFLKSDRPFAVGSKLDIEFTLPGTENPIKTQARVVRTCPPGNPDDHPPGMGIAFVEMDREYLRTIEEFIGNPGIY